MLATRNQLTHGIANMIQKNFKSICERIPYSQESKLEEATSLCDKKQAIDTLSTQPSGSPHFFSERTQFFFSKLSGQEQIEQFIQKKISSLLEDQIARPCYLQPYSLYQQCMGLIHTPQISHTIFILLPGTLYQSPYEVIGPLQPQQSYQTYNNQLKCETPISIFDLVQGVTSKQGKPTIEESQVTKMDLNERRESRGKENNIKGQELVRGKTVGGGSMEMKRIRPWSASNRGSMRKAV